MFALTGFACEDKVGYKIYQNTLEVPITFCSLSNGKRLNSIQHRNEEKNEKKNNNMKIKRMKKKMFACKVNLWSKRLKKKKRYISDNDNFGMLDDEMTMMIMQWKSGNEISNSDSEQQHQMHKYIRQRSNRTIFSSCEKEINVDLPKLYVRIRENVRSQHIKSVYAKSSSKIYYLCKKDKISLSNPSTQSSPLLIHFLLVRVRFFIFYFSLFFHF